MTPIPLADLPAIDPPLAAALSGLRNLETVLAWAPTLTGVDSVPMDEYNYDITVPLPDGRWAVFGVS